MKREWSLDELLVLFPSRVPDAEGVVVSRPAGPASGRARFTDEETAGHAEAEVSLSLGPAPEFKVRLAHSWPEGIHGERRRTLEHGMLLGIFKAVGSFAPPSVLGSCEVASAAVVCDGETTERAIHVAAFKATQQALASCKWTTFTPPFPDVAIEAGEALEEAFIRACQAFRAVGYDTREVGPLFDRSAREREFTRLFLIQIASPERSYAHYFFVCPFPWSEPLTAEIEKRLSSISYQEAMDGYYISRFHFLAAYPLPRSLATRQDVY